MAEAEKAAKVTSKDVAEMAKAGMAAIMSETKDPTPLTNFLKTTAHNLSLSETNRAALAVQAPGARNVMSYDGVKYKAHNSVREGEKAAAYLIAPRQNDKGRLYFVSVPAFSEDQLAKPVLTPAAEDLAKAVGPWPAGPTNGLIIGTVNAAHAALGQSDMDSNLQSAAFHIAALILQYRYDMVDPLLESKVQQKIMRPGLMMHPDPRHKLTPEEFARCCSDRQQVLRAATEYARFGNAVIERIVEIQKENPEVTLTAALFSPGEHGDLLADIALEAAGRTKPKEPAQYEIVPPKKVQRPARGQTAGKKPANARRARKPQAAER